MMARFTENVVENTALAWLDGLDCTVKHGPVIGPNGLTLKWP